MTRSGPLAGLAVFSDELIRAAVKVGEFSDPKAEKYLGDVLIKRRDKILALYLPAVNPIVKPRLEASGRLTIENAAIAAGVAKGQPTYRASWMLFDNATGDTKPLSTTESQTTTLTAPAGLPTGRQLHSGGYLGGSRGVPEVEATDQDALPPDGAGMESRSAWSGCRRWFPQRRRCRANRKP